MQNTVFLMYHELEEPGRPLCQSAPGYVRYILHRLQFQEQMQLMKKTARRGVSVTEALRFQPDSVAVTFDDGCETDLLFAAPILKELGFGATFFITTGFLGKPGYLNPAQVRELQSLGFEIGCHSMTHAYLSDLDEAGMRREMADAKFQLEQITGQPVQHFSCPGGRHNQCVADFARTVGYQTVSTSRMQANSSSSNPYALGRVAIMRDTSLSAFGDLCSARGLKRMDAMASMRQAIRRMLGNSFYDRLRDAVLGHDSTQ